MNAIQDGLTPSILGAGWKQIMLGGLVDNLESCYNTICKAL